MSGIAKPRRSKHEANRIFTLNDPSAPRLSPSLAKEIGLNESILFLQIEFLISVSEHVIDGRRWVYMSIRDWQAVFPFWGVATIHRTLKNLIGGDTGLIETGNFNRASYDKTNWFTVNMGAAARLESIEVKGVQIITTGTPQDTTDEVFQNGTGRCSDMEQGCSKMEQGVFQNGTTIPETTIPETTTDIKRGRSAQAQPPPIQALDISIESSLSKAIRAVCKKQTLVLSPKDHRDLIYILRGLPSGTTVADIEAFGRKCKFHWIGKDHAPNIMQVLEHWESVMEIPEGGNTQEVKNGNSRASERARSDAAIDQRIAEAIASFDEN